MDGRRLSSKLPAMTENEIAQARSDVKSEILAVKYLVECIGRRTVSPEAFTSAQHGAVTALLARVQETERELNRT